MLKGRIRVRQSVLLILLIFSAAGAQNLRVGLGYLPDVQFAPFYTALTEGLYAAEGLEVEFQHGFVSELYPLLSQGKLDFVVGDAEDENIVNPEDLAGKTVGLPGLFGSSYTAFRAVLRAAGLTETDLTVEQIGFTPLEAVMSGRVDVAMGFVNNEPLVLEQQGVGVNVIPAGPYSPAPGNGVIATDEVLEDPDLVRRFLSASQKGVALTFLEPERAFNASKRFIATLDEGRYRVLEATLPLFRSPYSDRSGVGFTHPARWEALLALLKETGRIETDLPATAFFSNAYLDQGVAFDGR